MQVDRSLTTNTGTLAINALFDNPDGLLLPGMFARVKVTGEVLPNAILIPQRAVQQLLDKTFVMVVGQIINLLLKPLLLVIKSEVIGSLKMV